ncbi:hypothetical protein DRE_02194 [Drechslerella stenobrocha 248]|uniref:Uncharacterized protein n=1 Tax=Drechslerella stenobrocha 248 TaxID=1043628 RepID=W7IGS2_9PEZI|nr:hypothetical protein DRE_02194 [Drechslerella stenobrocha 248]
MDTGETARAVESSSRQRCIELWRCHICRLVYSSDNPFCITVSKDSPCCFGHRGYRACKLCAQWSVCINDGGINKSTHMPAMNTTLLPTSSPPSSKPRFILNGLPSPDLAQLDVQLQVPLQSNTPKSAPKIHGGSLTCGPNQTLTQRPLVGLTQAVVSWLEDPHYNLYLRLPFAGSRAHLWPASARYRSPLVGFPLILSTINQSGKQKYSYGQSLETHMAGDEGATALVRPRNAEQSGLHEATPIHPLDQPSVEINQEHLAVYTSKMANTSSLVDLQSQTVPATSKSTLSTDTLTSAFGTEDTRTSTSTFDTEDTRLSTFDVEDRQVSMVNLAWAPWGGLDTCLGTLNTSDLLPEPPGIDHMPPSREWHDLGPDPPVEEDFIQSPVDWTVGVGAFSEDRGFLAERDLKIKAIGILLQLLFWREAACRLGRESSISSSILEAEQYPDPGDSDEKGSNGYGNGPGSGSASGGVTSSRSKAGSPIEEEGQDGKPSNSGRKRRDRDDDENDNGDQPTKRRKTVSVRSLDGMLACPFAKGKPQTHMDCVLIGRKNLAGIKEHCKRNHFNEKTPWGLKAAKDWDSVFDFCNPNWSPRPRPTPYVDMLESLVNFLIWNSERLDPEKMSAALAPLGFQRIHDSLHDDVRTESRTLGQDGTPFNPDNPTASNLCYRQRALSRALALEEWQRQQT